MTPRNKILWSSVSAVMLLFVLYLLMFGGDIAHLMQKKSATPPATAVATSTAYDFISSVPVEVVASGCDESLWTHNDEEEKVSAPCISITGVVQKVKAEDDGDMNIQLKPDAGYETLLNSFNREGQGSNIAVEPICVVKPKKADFKEVCMGYTSTVTIPAEGDRIRVTGSYGQDKHHWMEIHPPTKIEIL